MSTILPRRRFRRPEGRNCRRKNYRPHAAARVAGLIGTVAVAAVYLETWIPPRFRWLRWAAWGLIVTYMATAAAAVLRS